MCTAVSEHCAAVHGHCSWPAEHLVRGEFRIVDRWTLQLCVGKAARYLNRLRLARAALMHTPDGLTPAFGAAIRQQGALLMVEHTHMHAHTDICVPCLVYDVRHACAYARAHNDTHRLDMALWMKGGPSALRGARLAALAARASSVAVDDSHTEVKVRVSLFLCFTVRMIVVNSIIQTPMQKSRCGAAGLWLCCCLQPLADGLRSGPALVGPVAAKVVPGASVARCMMNHANCQVVMGLMSHTTNPPANELCLWLAHMVCAGVGA